VREKRQRDVTEKVLCLLIVIERHAFENCGRCPRSERAPVMRYIAEARAILTDKAEAKA